MSAQLIEALSEVEYHAHPALSASGAKRLIQTCPAIFKHERDHGRPNKAAYDFGHAAHGLILGVGEQVHVVEADDWRSKAARELRDAAYATGGVPMLAAEWEQAQALTAAVKAHPLAGRLFADGTAEQSVIWRDERWDVERRARFDWLTERAGRHYVVDLKTTTTADPAVLGRKVADFGYHQQEAWYRDAAAAVGLDDVGFLFVFVEKTAPHIVTVVELDQYAVYRGRELNDRALEIFRDCTTSGIWPGYVAPTERAVVSLPRWATYDNTLETA